jgi:hypothetical protein
VVREITLANDPYLDDHRLDGTPVLPFASATELMVSTAAAARPDLVLQSVETVRNNEGIILQGDRPRSVNLVASLVEGPDSNGVVTYEVQADGGTRAPRPNYQCRVRLGPENLPSPDGPMALRNAEPSVITVEEAYDWVLFHGPAFQKVTRIDAVSPHGASAILASLAPRSCLGGVAPDARWLVDPILFDAALQMMVIWGRIIWDVTLLPARLGAMEFYGPGPAIVGHDDDAEVQMELRVTESKRTGVGIGDVHFLVGGKVVAKMHSMEGVGSKALNRLARS